MLGTRTIVVDIDNTLARPNSLVPLPYVERWIKEMRIRGIRIIAVSNNSEERTSAFCRKLGIPYIARARKPLTFRSRERILNSELDKNYTVVLGDQVFTDVLFARMLGTLAILVAPAVKEESLFFRFKRALERIVLKDRNWCR